MSSFDAAPLPRLGEVFFDVRGSSRSMRLSWYSDTGVAVFSIWQGGRCSGTFRLPVDDLARMVELLRRSPGSGLPGPARPAGEGWPGRAPEPEDVATGYLAGPASGSYESDFPTDYPPPRAPVPRESVPREPAGPDSAGRASLPGTASLPGVSLLGAASLPGAPVPGVPVAGTSVPGAAM